MPSFLDSCKKSNESFATYSQGLWIEHTQGHEALNEWIKGEYDFVTGSFDFLIPPGEPPADDLFNSGVYDWGSLGLHALRLEVGDHAFFDTLKTYYDRFQGGNVTTDDFIEVAEEVSGQKLNSFFERWIYSENLAPIPELGLSFPGSIVGSDTRDVLVGTDEVDDIIYAAGGNDIAAGGLGDDTLYGEAGKDVLRGDLNSRSAGGFIGGDDLLYGGAGNDRLSGKGGDDQLSGDEGKDFMWGNKGDDQLSGDEGKDFMWGNRGDDLLWGGTGHDFLFGGKGADTFIIAASESTDTIRDFKLGKDKIGLAGGLTFAQLSFGQNDNATFINFEDEVLAQINRLTASLTNADFVTIA